MDNDYMQKVADFAVCEIGRGHRHPTAPDPSLETEYQRLLVVYPFLSNHPDYLHFLERYAGARAFAQEGHEEGFFHVTIYGVGSWAFSDECPTAVSSDGYYVFAVVETQAAKGSADVRDAIASYGFDSTGRTGIFGETHSSGEPDGAFKFFCQSFTEWLRLLIDSRGRLLPRESC
jgi:hypothetical protein